MYHDHTWLQDIEFTVENRMLFILETRTAKRTAQASVCAAVMMVKEKLITEREAMLRIDAQQMDFFLHPMIDTERGRLYLVYTPLLGVSSLRVAHLVMWYNPNRMMWLVFHGCLQIFLLLCLLQLTRTTQWCVSACCAVVRPHLPVLQ